MPAYLAQGACQAIEDADALASVLADCQGPNGVAAALAGYQARRVPRATRVSRARQVWESGPLPRRPADDYAASDWLYAPSGPLPFRVTVPRCRDSDPGCRRAPAPGISGVSLPGVSWGGDERSTHSFG
jgi:salicylate hydroxylase